MSDQVPNIENSSVFVIGGGVIGVSIAYYLARKGIKVSIVEKDEVCSGCSYGNAGLLVSSYSIPLAAPGAVTKAMKWMFDSESPFYIKPRFDLDLFSWLFRFALASRKKVSDVSLVPLRDLSLASLALHETLAQSPGMEFEYERKGHLSLYHSEQGFDSGRRDAELLQRFGIPSDFLDAAGIHELEPAALPSLFGGVYFPGDRHVSPEKFVQNLLREVKRMGVSVHSQTEVTGFETVGRKISLIKTSTRTFKPDLVVLAAGSWSSEIAQSLRTSVHLQPAKGYSVTINKNSTSPKIPLMLGEAKVAITPMGNELRAAGTLELSGFDLSINQRRVDSILKSIGNYITAGERFKTGQTWIGLRPCTPDGLPLIGRSEKYDNLIIATGHGMLGMTLGPITGKLVSEIVSGDPSTVALDPFRVGRFD